MQVQTRQDDMVLLFITCKVGNSTRNSRDTRLQAEDLRCLSLQFSSLRACG